MKAKLTDKKRNVYIFSTDKQRPRRTKYMYMVCNFSRNSDKYYVQRILLDREQEFSKDPGKIILNL